MSTSQWIGLRFYVDCLSFLIIWHNTGFFQTWGNNPWSKQGQKISRRGLPIKLAQSFYMQLFNMSCSWALMGFSPFIISTILLLVKITLDKDLLAGR